MEKSDGTVRLFSALEVANLCGFKNQTAINWIKKGDIKAFTTPGGQYRVYPEDLLEFMTTRNMRIPKELADLVEHQPASRKILIVDDDKELNSMIQQYLTRKLPNFSVAQAFDGFEAGKLLAEEKPGLVILDIDLPGIDGHQLCKRIKSDPRLRALKILAITGLSDPSTRDTIIQEGADAFMGKPLDLDDLLEAVLDLVSPQTVRSK